MGGLVLYCVVLYTVSLALLAFGVFCTCCGLLYGRVDKPLNGDLRMTNDGSVQREYVCVPPTCDYNESRPFYHLLMH